MRKFIVAFVSVLLLTLSFTALCVFLTEKTDLFNLKNLKIEATFTEENGSMTMTWTKYPYPCFYKVDVYSKTTGKVAGSGEYHHLKNEYTFENSYHVPTTAIPNYYKVTAYGIFGKLSSDEIFVPNPNYNNPMRPIPIYRYTRENPASPIPYFVWHSIPDGVLYEFELLSGPPDEENTTTLSKTNHLTSTQQVFTNGVQFDLRPYLNQPRLYWRVRALNLRKEPIGVFSTAEPIVVDSAKTIPNKPLLNNFDVMPDFQQPIYPVYHWIPMFGAINYEVELMAEPPLEENNTAPTPHRAWAKVVNDSFSCYDEYPRMYAGKYYWRVRAVNAKGETIGVYSDTDTFEMPAHLTRPFAAAFGDSITHGGGAVSFSPSSMEYSYTTYLDFPAINIGRSGDTSRMSLDRFDQDVVPIKPINLMILTGSNCLRNPYITAETVISDLEGIYQKCISNDIRPIMLTLPPVNPANIMLAFRTPTDPNWYTKMVAINKYIKSKPYYIDLEPYFYDPTHTFMDPVFANDGLHPDIMGKMIMAEIINQHKDVFKQ
ncbi:lipolytic enzyme, G-D-S-L family [Anaerovibrio sp. JC8]|uniref:SGNH/GDSL hydrolase family protein n=1 Tax=Anaerovibrio sp. JC8 TaxID=1240085 RepID=UPI000A0E845A|nr:GDSL-type esterase/lipase family protein [Anaerovibrio sp. JC8]ORT99726.1 lipolytic enzyme, G-D-S-L family [Anaerovibrio sp. JC8]